MSANSVIKKVIITMYLPLHTTISGYETIDLKLLKTFLFLHNHKHSHYCQLDNGFNWQLVYID